MTPQELGALRKNAVRHFVQSALLIDDEATLEPNEAVDAGPKTANPPRASIIPVDAPAEPASAIAVAPQRVDGPEAEGRSIEQPAKAEPAQPLVEASRVPPAVPQPTKHEGGSDAAPSPLNAKALTDAFLAESVICGVFRPEKGEDPATLTAGSAAHADIVIIDWFLWEKNPLQAKAMILSLLKADTESQGRLRLIAIYTNNPDRGDMAGQVFAALHGDQVTHGHFRLKDGVTVVGASTRIVFLNKAGTAGAEQAEIVEETQLPSRLMDEFSELTKGLLSTFAVEAIAVVRNATPHILSLFAESLDGSYLGHRAALPDPDDALPFAVELVTDELRNAIENHEVAETHLGPEVLKAWVQGRGQVSFTDGKTTIQAAAVNQLIDHGEAAFKEPLWYKNGDLTQQSSKIREAYISRIFYADDAAALSANKRLARLALFRNEALGRRRVAPEEWRPYLTLGSVIRPFDQAEGKPGFLVCLQPGCDSVRLDEKPTTFPFQIANDVTEKFNIVVKHDESDGSTVRVEWRPRDGVMIKFRAEQPVGRVFAEKSDDGSTFVFTDESGAKYQWVGDLKALKAQSIVAQIGARMQGVALDDLEWLRRHAEGKG